MISQVQVSAAAEPRSLGAVQATRRARGYPSDLSEARWRLIAQYRPHLITGCLAATGLIIDA